MKVKGLQNKIYRLNPIAINFNVKKLEDLKNGDIVDLAKEDADNLLNKGMVELVKTSKKGDK